MSLVRFQAPVIVFAPLIVAALVNRNDTVAVIEASADSPSMLHFQKLDVYQRSIEFLA